MIGTTKMRRRSLLTTVSTAALLMAICAPGAVWGADADKTPVWLELGWHFEDVTGLGDDFLPPFLPEFLNEGFAPVTNLQRQMGYGYGGESKISFQPDNSNWIFSGSVRYGRAHGNTNKHEQTSPTADPAGIDVTSSGVYLFGFHSSHLPKALRFENAGASNQETHLIVDFQAGRDVGLGFGGHVSSRLNAGIRFAQMHSRSASNLSGDPDFGFTDFYSTTPCCSGWVIHRKRNTQHFHRYEAALEAERSFRGIGPSLSWDASSPLAGNPQDGELGADWGVNAALLFGRQTAKVAHTIATHDRYQGFYGALVDLGNQYTSFSVVRSRRVTVPNLGGFAAISYRYADAKLSIGYRADYFFNAIDGGIDARHNLARGFFGPFASISIGIGGASE